MLHHLPFYHYQNVYRQQYDRTAGGTDDARLHTLTRRLWDKIEPDRKRPRYIITVRGEGYRFVESEVQQA
jgi:DNA-binding response OmpR family regulator